MDLLQFELVTIPERIAFFRTYHFVGAVFLGFRRLVAHAVVIWALHTLPQSQFGRTDRTRPRRTAVESLLRTLAGASISTSQHALVDHILHGLLKVRVVHP